MGQVPSVDVIAARLEDLEARIGAFGKSTKRTLRAIAERVAALEEYLLRGAKRIADASVAALAARLARLEEAAKECTDFAALCMTASSKTVH